MTSFGESKAQHNGGFYFVKICSGRKTLPKRRKFILIVKLIKENFYLEARGVPWLFFFSIHNLWMCVALITKIETLKVFAYETSKCFSKNSFNFETLVTNLLLKVFTVDNYTIFPLLWQFVDARPKKWVLLWTRYRPNFSHFRNKGCVSPKVRSPSRQIGASHLVSNRLVSPWASYPNYMTQPIHKSQFGVPVHLYQAKLNCIVLFDIMAVSDKKNGSIWPIALESVSY